MADEDEEFEFRLRAEKEVVPAAKPDELQGSRARAQASIPGVGSVIGGIVASPFEMAAHVGSQMAAMPVQAAASVYQLATAPKGRKIERANEAIGKVSDAMVYQPKTEVGKAMTGALDTVSSLPQRAGQAVGKGVTSVTGSPAAGAATDLAIEAGSAFLGAKGAGAAKSAIVPAARRVAERGEQTAAIRAAEQAPVNAAIEGARSAGYKLPPSQAGGAVGKMLEGAGGKIQTEMKFSRDNAVNTNKIAAKEIGLSERQPMTEANLDRLKQKAFGVYDQVKQAGRIVMDDQYKAELDKVRERTGQEATDFPEDFSEAIEKEIAKFDKPGADAASMLEKVKKLRARAGKNMSALDADKFELGIAQKKIATAMENQIERSVQATNPELIANFRAARTQLAKIYNVEEALGPSGNVTAAVLARQLKRGVPLSGGLKSIAETYQEFPKVMRSVEGLGGHAPFSALDYLVGGVEAIAHPAAAGRIVGALAMRPVARGIIGSKNYQRAAIRPRVERPSTVASLARQIAGPDKAHTLAELPPPE